MPAQPPEVDPRRAAIRGPGDAVVIDADERGVEFRAGPVSRVLTWDQLRQMLLAGDLRPVRWGVVVDGALTRAFDTPTQARDHAAEGRRYGSTACVVEVPDDVR